MPRPRLSASLRRARVGVSLLFFANGAMFSALLPRYPEFKHAFALDNGEFGLLVIAFPVGALLAAGYSGTIIRRFGTLPTSVYGSIAVAAAFIVAGASHVAWTFALGLVLAGASDAVVEAAENVQGVAVERALGRSIMNSFHALWSAGAATGGAIGAVASAVHLSPGLQMTVNGAIWSVVAAIACRLADLHPAGTESHTAVDVPRRGSPAPERMWRLLLPLVVLAICGTLVEDVANNWAILYLEQIVDAPTVVAGMTLTAVLAAQLIGRVLGDPMTDRWGRGRVASGGGALVTVGALLVILAPIYPLAFLGFVVTGFGSATLIPAAFAGAGRTPGLRQGTGIARLGWFMRLGFLVTSPAIGWLSEITNLRTAMLIPAAAGLLAASLARRLNVTGPS